MESSAHTGNVFSINNGFTDAGYDYVTTGRKFGIGPDPSWKPSYLFQVDGTASSNYAVLSKSNVNQSVLGYTSAGGYFSLNDPTGATSLIRFNAGGVNKINDGNNLEMVGNTAGVFGQYIQNLNSGGSAYTTLYFGSSSAQNDVVIGEVGSGNSTYGGSKSAFFVTNTAAPIIFGASGLEKIRMTANGALAFGGASNYGSSGQILQSNGDAAPTWVTPTIITGTYTPTCSAITNVDAVSISSGAVFYYTKITYAGGPTVVNVDGWLSIDLTAGTPTSSEVDITVPVASTFTSAFDAVGSFTPSNNIPSGQVFAESSGSYRARCVITGQTSTSALNYSTHFSYTVK
jgi:hypothetical protein